MSGRWLEIARVTNKTGKASVRKASRALSRTQGKAFVPRGWDKEWDKEWDEEWDEEWEWEWDEEWEWDKAEPAWDRRVAAWDKADPAWDRGAAWDADP